MISTIALVWYSLGWAACGVVFASGGWIRTGSAVTIIIFWPLELLGLINQAASAYKKNQYLWRRK